MTVEFVAVVPVVAVVEVVTLVEVVSMVGMVAEVAVFAMVEEFCGGCGSDDNCSGAVIRGGAMMAVVWCSNCSCDHLSGGDGCISAMELKHYHYYTANCHNCNHCPLHCHHGLNKRHQYNWHN